MPKFNIAYARIEHQIFSFEVTANSEEDARMQVETVMEADDFDWLNYEIVHRAATSTITGFLLT